MKKEGLQPRLLYPARLTFKMEGEIRNFPDQKKKKGLKKISTKSSLQEMLKGQLKEDEEKERERNTSTKGKMQKKKKNPINNNLKCKWVICSTQKT